MSGSHQPLSKTSPDDPNRLSLAQASVRRHRSNLVRSIRCHIVGETVSIGQTTSDESWECSNQRKTFASVYSQDIIIGGVTGFGRYKFGGRSLLSDAKGYCMSPPSPAHIWSW